MLNGKRVLFAVMLASASALAMAQSGTPQPGTPGDPANFAAYKQKELAQIAAHIQVAQTLQTCVQDPLTGTAFRPVPEVVSPMRKRCVNAGGGEIV